MCGFRYSVSGGKEAVRWSPYKEELAYSNSLSLELMPPKSGLVEKEGRCTSPVKDLVWDRTGSRYLVPGELSYVPSSSKKNEHEPCHADVYF